MNLFAQELTEHEILSGILSDMYREVYGVHPRHYHYDSMSVRDLKEAMAYLEPLIEAVVNDKKSCCCGSNLEV